MSTDQLTARLERLERSHVRMKRLATVLGVLLAATFAGAMNEDEVPDVIRAKRFEVWSRPDSPSLVLGSNEDGARIEYIVGSDRPGLFPLLDADGVVRANRFEVYRKSEPYAKAILDTDENGARMILVSKMSGVTHGSAVVRLNIDESGTGQLTLSDGGGNSRLLRPGD